MTHAEAIDSLPRHNEVTDAEIAEEYYGVSLNVGHAIENFDITSKGMPALRKALDGMLGMKRKSKQVKADIAALKLNVCLHLDIDESEYTSAR